jgi:hypothetical protein
MVKDKRTVAKKKRQREKEVCRNKWNEICIKAINQEGRNHDHFLPLLYKLFIY